ncbi:MAG: manganese efflux pump MntP family protein [Spirochaetaceae bacterium]|jgi:putative Mn2+ efflux pump MntP|nr:manganese efflux pump MntP family protein [Spirochaetaceae bacterium]
MGLLEIILIAVSLAMDAFAVSITLGLSVKKCPSKKPKLTEIMIPGLYFGFFQSLMPAIGYFAGIFFVSKLEDLDHWIALALLGCIGGKMIKDSFSKEDREEKHDKNSFGFVKMLLLAIATSIDALAVGTTFAFFKVNIYTAIAITGPVTFFIATSGVLIGSVFGTKFRSKAEFAGGAVLVIIGIKILAEHLFF